MERVRHVGVQRGIVVVRGVQHVGAGVLGVQRGGPGVLGVQHGVAGFRGVQRVGVGLHDVRHVAAGELGIQHEPPVVELDRELVGELGILRVELVEELRKN